MNSGTKGSKRKFMHGGRREERGGKREERGGKGRKEQIEEEKKGLGEEYRREKIGRRKGCFNSPSLQVFHVGSRRGGRTCRPWGRCT